MCLWFFNQLGKSLTYCSGVIQSALWRFLPRDVARSGFGRSQDRHTRAGGYPVRRDLSVLTQTSRNTGSSGLSAIFFCESLDSTNRVDLVQEIRF